MNILQTPSRVFPADERGSLPGLATGLRPVPGFLGMAGWQAP